MSSADTLYTTKNKKFLAMFLNGKNKKLWNFIELEKVDFEKFKVSRLEVHVT